MDAPNENDTAEYERRLNEIVAKGPSGTFAVAGVATFIVVAIVFIFYFVVYLPRGAVQ